MGGLSFWHILIVILVIVLLFGAGKIPRLMKDLGTGIKAFKGTMKEDSEADKDATPPAAAPVQPAPVVQTAPQPQIIQPQPVQPQPVVRDANDNVASAPARKTATRKKQTKA